VIPEDWEVAALGSLGQFKNGINKPKAAFGSGHPFVNLMDVFGVGYISSSADLGLLESNDADRSMYDLRAGDVLFIRSSVKPSGVGLTTVITQDLPSTVFSGFLLRYRDQGQLTTEYKKHCFHDARFRARVIANSTVSANTNINQQALKALVIGYPPATSEQASIAEALSDMDEAITAQEAVIAKKRALKTAAMQALLSGIRRLPGFSGEWEKVQIGKLGRWVGGATPSMANARYWTDGTIPWASSSDVRSGRLSSTRNRITSDAVKNTATREVPEGTILVVSRSGILRRFLPVAIATRNIAINQDLKALLVDPAFDPNFIYHAISVQGDEILKACMKAGTTVESIDLDWLKQFELAVPQDKNEQTAIATALFDGDDEITLQDAKLAKLRDLKAGMMQQLLTGKIRLI
jgi:type I restriction enzyme S subunit